MNDRLDEALDVLRLVGTPNSEAELGDIREPLHRERDQKQASLFEIRAGKLRYATPIFLAIAIRAFNQLSGINAILYYLNDIFAAAGFSRVSGNVQAVAVGAMNLARRWPAWRSSIALDASSSCLRALSELPSALLN